MREEGGRGGGQQGAGDGLWGTALAFCEQRWYGASADPSIANAKCFVASLLSSWGVKADIKQPSRWCTLNSKLLAEGSARAIAQCRLRNTDD